MKLLEKIKHDVIYNELSIETINNYFYEIGLTKIQIQKIGEQLLIDKNDTIFYPVYFPLNNPHLTDSFRKKHPYISQEFNNMIFINNHGQIILRYSL